MKKNQCPYAFSAKSRAAMIAYCTARDTYSNGYEVFPFVWNVKTHGANWQHPKGDYELDASLDAAWQKHMDSGYDFAQFVFESTGSYYTDNEWCSYPGADQGDWQFSFEGRSGGWLALIEWRGHRLSRMSMHDLKAWLSELPFTELRAFYRGIVCADQDLTPQNAAIKVEYEVNFRRHEWECELQESREASYNEFARSYEASRPDLYATHV